MFSLIVTLVIIQKLKAEPKNLYHSSDTIALSKGTIFAKKTLIFLQKNIDSSKDKRPLLKDIFSKTTYMYVFTH